MAPTYEALLSFTNPVFRAYAFYSATLAVKMFCMSPFTGFQRYKKNVFANPEDRKDKNSKVGVDPDVERVRRAHLNDLENIPAFWVAGLLYCLTDPSPVVAINLFRVYTACRIVHTFVYAVVPVPQPARALAFTGAMMCAMYMAISTIIHFA